jgi:hypothetical protein
MSRITLDIGLLVGYTSDVCLPTALPSTPRSRAWPSIAECSGFELLLATPPMAIDRMTDAPAHTVVGLRRRHRA